MLTKPLTFAALPLLAVFGLAACAPAPAIDPLPPQEVITPATGIVGLTTREPTLFCKAETYVPYLGQPGSTIPMLGVDRAYRVVEYRGIEPQDYDPNRVIFRLDAAGNIANIDCG